MSYKFKYGTKELTVPKTTEVIKLNNNGLVIEQIKQANGGTSWINGRNVALVKNIVGAPSSWCALASMKTPNGSWEMGILGENLYFSYAKDIDYNQGKNETSTVSIDPYNNLSAIPSNHNHSYATWLGAQYASGGDWLGWYNVYGGTRRGYIQHNGNDFSIYNDIAGSDTVIKGDEVAFLNGKGTRINWWNDNASYGGYFTPLYGNNAEECCLGTSVFRWHRCYVQYAESVASDERLKRDIIALKDISKKRRSVSNENVYELLFSLLIPKTYKMNDQIELENNKIHIGFVAQDIAKSIEELGFDKNDLSIVEHSFYIDEESNEEKDIFVMCYQELIALNTHMIQKLYNIVDQQQKQIDELKEKIILLNRGINN